ncbi:MAG TPA: hypothetical protein V6C95_21595 [Coleofasciculaceae cyanobacterium]
MVFSTRFKKFSLTTGFLSLLSLASLVSPAPSSATIVNGSFENNNFSNWETFGRTFIKTSRYSSTPTDGTYQALLDTVALNETTDEEEVQEHLLELADFLNLEVNRLINLRPGQVYEGSAIKTSFTAKIGDVLSFDWNFLTDSEEGDFMGWYNDLAFMTLSQDVDDLADTFSPLVRSLTVYANETGYKTFKYTFKATGIYILGLAVADVGDGSRDSALLVDNVKLTTSTEPTDPPTPIEVPEPLSVLGLLFFASCGVGCQRSHRPK